MKLPDDDKLVSFLQRHRPLPAPASADQEKQLFALIDTQQSAGESSGSRFESAQSSVAKRCLWTIPGAIAAVLLAWGGYRLLVPSLQRAQATQLDTFLVKSWNTAVEGTDRDRADNSEANWLLLANP